MALPTFNPPIGPSPGTANKPQVKILEADFGDGYSQPTRDGLNHIKKMLSLTWDALELSQRNTIIAFLEARGGTDAFYYQPAGAPAPIKWTCPVWDDKLDDGVWKVSVQFKQSFTLEV